MVRGASFIAKPATNHKTYAAGAEHDVRVVQIKKTVWHASGVFLGKRMVATGRTEPGAVTSWERLARIKNQE